MRFLHSSFHLIAGVESQDGLSMTFVLLLLLLALPTSVALPQVPAGTISKSEWKKILVPSVIFLVVVLVLWLIFLIINSFRELVDLVRPPPPPGFSPEELATFPSMSYLEAKARLPIAAAAAGELEQQKCSVCLDVFKDGDTVRQLPTCLHVFHLGCIDLWLAAHITCPTCRAILLLPGADANAAAVDHTVIHVLETYPPAEAEVVELAAPPPPLYQLALNATRIEKATHEAQT